MQMNSTPKGEFLLIVFRPEVTLAFSEAQPPQKFSIEAVDYRATPAVDSTSFYDWLRNASGKVIGLRYWPTHEVKLPLEALAHLPYVRVVHEGENIEVYFSANREADDSRSDDQSFGGDACYLSAS